MADLKSNLEQQIDELELLQSMFSAPGEFQIEDQSTFDQASAFIRDLTPATPGRLSCSLHIPIDAHQPAAPGASASGGDSHTDQHILNISIRLPHSYPEILPEVYISSDDLSRTGQDDLNTDLQGYMSSSILLGEVCLLTITEWIRDNAAGYFPTQTASELNSEGLDVDETSSHFCRMWLYMHHIYSKTKRRDILSLASELDLTGFMLAGKPGVVCVEGDVRNTKQFYSILRRWNWKSITCRKKEIVADRDIGVQRKITGFQELGLDTHGPRQNHMDMGQFLDYLRRHGLEYMFKTLFGVEGHTMSPPVDDTKRT